MHPDVQKIAFTGSANVGKQILKMAADSIKRVTLELRGKSPNIFFADSDFEAAVDGALFGVFINVVKALRVGIVWVNHMQPTYVEAPWGGYKQSGFGRELGPWGIEEYLETKQVYVNLNEQPIGWY